MHMEARRYVWEGAIPLQIHLHESEVTTLPPPPPALILAPRIGYLPLLVGLIKPYFSNSLPPGVDTIWFEYKSLPLKWHIPTGVLFDLLCAEPERPWNLTVHFRGYPQDTLIPCEGGDSVKWSYINSLKEAACIINGNCKNVMNMSQSDQVELWSSVMNVAGNLEAYLQVSSKLKLVTVEDEYTVQLNLSSKSQQGTGEADVAGQVKTGRIPVRLYVRSVSEDFDDLEDAPNIDSWDKISFINRPVEIHIESKCFTLHDAIKTLLPEYFTEKPLVSDESPKLEDEELKISSEDADSNKNPVAEDNLYEHVTRNAEIKLLRIQGIEPKLQIPFSWVVNNLINPDYFLYICICLKIPVVSTL